MRDLLNELNTLLQAQFTTTFKKYIVGAGRLTQIPNKSLPALIISGISTSITNQGSGTVRDNNNFSVQIKIVDEIKQYFNNVTGNQTQSDSTVQHYEWFEDRNADGGVKNATILGVIRDNFTLDSWALFNDEITINYDIEPEGTLLISEMTLRFNNRTNR